MRLSERAAWKTDSTPLARAQDSARSRPSVIDLCESNPTRCGFSYPEAQLSAALVGPGWSVYSPDPQGLPSARRALREYYRSRGGSVDAEEILLTASTSEAYSLLFKLLCDPGDDILIPNPSYPLFEYLAQLESVQARAYPLSLDLGWRLDIDEVAAAATSRTKAVLVVNPGNPTGSFIKGEQLEGLQALCAERGWALVSDEVFSDYGLGVEEGRVETILKHPGSCLSFALSGLSKAAGLPQLKLAWFCVAGPKKLKAEAVRRLEFILDCYLSVNTLAQRALPEILALAPSLQAQIRERVARNLRKLEQAVPQAAPWSVLRPEAGWSGIIRMPREVDEEQVCLRLIDAGVIVQPGYFFDFPLRSFLVLSLLVEPRSFDPAVERIAKVLGHRW